MKTVTLLAFAFISFTGIWHETENLSFPDSNLPPDTERNTEQGYQSPSFEGILEMQGIGGNAIYYIKGEQVRSEIRDENEVAIFLYSFNGTSYTAIMPSEKIYMEAPVKQINFSDKDLNEMNNCDGKVNKTGEMQTIHGTNCEEWVNTCGNDHSVMWVTRELGFEWGQIFHPMYRSSYAGTMSQYSAMKGYFPMKMSVTNKKGKSEVLMEVVKLERKELDPGLFVVPKDFKSY